MRAYSMREKKTCKERENVTIEIESLDAYIRSLIVFRFSRAALLIGALDICYQWISVYG